MPHMFSLFSFVMSRIHGTYFDENVIFATKPFNCVICAAEGNKSAGKLFQHDSLDFSPRNESFVEFYPYQFGTFYVYRFRW